jgi:hypothetical protein
VVEREDNLYESLLIWEVEAKKHHRRRSSNKRHQPAVGLNNVLAVSLADLCLEPRGRVNCQHGTLV